MSLQNLMDRQLSLSFAVVSCHFFLDCLRLMSWYLRSVFCNVCSSFAFSLTFVFLVCLSHHLFFACASAPPLSLNILSHLCDVIGRLILYTLTSTTLTDVQKKAS